MRLPWPHPKAEADFFNSILCKPGQTSNCRAVAHLLSSATATTPQAGRALFCRKCMSHKGKSL